MFTGWAILSFVSGAEEIGFRPLSVPSLAKQHSFPLPQPLQNQHFRTLSYQRKSTRLKILSFHTLAHSFALIRTQRHTTPNKSIFCALFAKNTRGRGRLAPSTQNLFFGKSLSAPTPPTLFFSGKLAAFRLRSDGLHRGDHFGDGHADQHAFAGAALDLPKRHISKRYATYEECWWRTAAKHLEISQFRHKSDGSSVNRVIAPRPDRGWSERARIATISN
jgi:hypothetical protein